MQSTIRDEIQRSALVLDSMLQSHELIEKTELFAKHCVTALKNGKKILVAGNGGSAADAQHFAGELVSRFMYDRPGLPAIALTTDTSILTAIGNDYGYENLFSRQIQALGASGDIFLAISTSGNSKNILKAISAAKDLGVFVVGLTGATGGAMKDLCDVCLSTPSDSTPKIQEGHLVIEHIVCGLIEANIFPKT